MNVYISKKRPSEITQEDIERENQEYDLSFWKAECEYLTEELSKESFTAEIVKNYRQKHFELLAIKLNINPQDASCLVRTTTETGFLFTHPSTNISYNLSFEEYGDVWDEALDVQDNLIRFSDMAIAPYSPLKFDPELMDYVLSENKMGKNLTELLKGLSIQQQSFDRVDELIKENTSQRTRILRQSGLVYWVAWLRAKGISLNKLLTYQDVCEFIVDHIEGMDEAVDKRLIVAGYKKAGLHQLTTVKIRLAALSVFYKEHGWPNPRDHHKVRELLHSLTRKHGGVKPSSRAITLDILNRMLDTCGKKINDIRDKALLLFGWSSGGRRRSEIAAANFEDLQEDADDCYVYTIPKSKTDQLGEGHAVPVNGRAALALKEWLHAAQITEGPIFRSITKGGVIKPKALSDDDINRIVKKRLKMANLDASLFGAHGLRSGFVTEAGKKNRPLGDVMALTTHKSHTVCMGYYRAGNIKHNSAANLADE